MHGRSTDEADIQERKRLQNEMLSGLPRSDDFDPQTPWRFLAAAGLGQSGDRSLLDSTAVDSENEGTKKLQLLWQYYPPLV
jgi:hypothetical protein